MVCLQWGSVVHVGQQSLPCFLANTLHILLRLLILEADFLNTQVMIIINCILWARITSVSCSGRSGPIANLLYASLITWSSCSLNGFGQRGISTCRGVSPSHVEPLPYHLLSELSGAEANWEMELWLEQRCGTVIVPIPALPLLQIRPEPVPAAQHSCSSKSGP